MGHFGRYSILCLLSILEAMVNFYYIYHLSIYKHNPCYIVRKVIIENIHTSFLFVHSF